MAIKAYLNSTRSQSSPQGFFFNLAFHAKALDFVAQLAQLVVLLSAATVTGKCGILFDFVLTFPATQPIGIDPQMSGGFGDTVAIDGDQSKGVRLY